MKIIHVFKNYEREPVIVIIKRWRSEENKKLAGLYEPETENDETAVISISEDLLKCPQMDQELFSTCIHEHLHCFFPCGSESQVAECSSKIVTALKKFGFSTKRTNRKIIKKSYN
jgi:hypothetical protein